MWQVFKTYEKQESKNYASHFNWTAPSKGAFKTNLIALN
jgi:hypothetical protein